MDEVILIQPYNQDWPRLFAMEHDLLAPALAPWLVGPIEHVGSTAVPGLAAKPIIDIMAPVESLKNSQPALRDLEHLGYCYAPYREDVMHWLCKPSPSVRTHHLHLVPFASSLWKDRIYFRDRLRADECLANNYAALKHRLAQMYGNDREAYTQAKTPFIAEVLGRAA
jgi:GrpB-like predicted nucleotidyltransferase (UPF0157 family)